MGYIYMKSIEPGRPDTAKENSYRRKERGYIGKEFGYMAKENGGGEGNTKKSSPQALQYKKFI